MQHCVHIIDLPSSVGTGVFGHLCHLGDCSVVSEATRTPCPHCRATQGIRITLALFRFLHYLWATFAYLPQFGPHDIAKPVGPVQVWMDIHELLL